MVSLYAPYAAMIVPLFLKEFLGAAMIVPGAPYF